MLCLEIVELARPGDGGAVTAYEMDQRRAALGDLDRAARRALVGACSGRSALTASADNLDPCWPRPTPSCRGPC